MKEKITDQPLEAKSKSMGRSTEVEITKLDYEEAHGSAMLNKVRAAFMKTCGTPNADFLDTEGMSRPKALVGCAMTWKNTAMKGPIMKAMEDPLMQGVLGEALTPQEMKNLKAYVKNLKKDESLPKALEGVLVAGASVEETGNWEKVRSPNREEYAQAKTKKQWEKVDKKELKKDTKKEKEEHEKDAVKDDESKIKKLKKGKPSEKKDVEEHDLKKDEELDEEDKTKYTKADDAPWEKVDTKELKRDTKKEKKEHEKDAVKDDESKIKNLKKGKPSEKKSVEEHDLKKDEKFDKKKGKGGLPPWLKKKGGDEDEDEKELKKDTKKEKEGHEKDAVKDDKKQIKDLKKDEKEDKKAEKKDKRAKATDYSKYWEEAAERFGGKKRSKLKSSDFLDPKNRSFPVMSCKNVKAAVSTWGMYKGPMSFETFKRKLTSRAKKLGCEGSLPKAWKDK